MKGCCSFKAIVDGVCVHSPKDRNCTFCNFRAIRISRVISLLVSLPDLKMKSGSALALIIFLLLIHLSFLLFTRNF